MHHFSIDLRTTAAWAVVCMLPVVGATPNCNAQAAPSQKKYKEGEYEIVSQAYKNADDPAKEIADLDAWSKKVPDSDYKEDRAYLYLQACVKLNQPAKVLQYGSQLMSRDLNAVFSSAGTEQLAGLPIKLTMLNVLYSVALNAASLPNATPDQLALGQKAARALVDFGPRYFTPGNKPAAQTDAAWAAARTDVMSKAQAAIIAIALKPGLDAQQKKDCPTQESAFSKALTDFPDSGAAAYQLGIALLTCEGGNAEKLSQGLWEVARAASLDPSKSGLDAKDLPGIDSYLKKVYTRIHGNEEGLEQLKKLAVGAPLAPPDFRIKSAAEISQEKQAEFERSNPQLALWMRIKGQLVETNGDQYFQGQLKDAGVPQLTGTLIEARPACHSKELVVAVPSPETERPLKAEITLKLDKPLAGQPEVDKEFRWEGVPTAFTKEPFMLTMDIEAIKISGLTISPCTPAPARSGARNSTASRKK